MAQNQIDFDPAVDYYKALGVDQSASADEIKKAYRKLAKENHPDSTGGDKRKETRFKGISNAYDVLGDKKKKDLYDQIRVGGGSRGGNPFAGGGGGYTYTSGGGGPGVFDLGELFSQVFTGAAGGVRGTAQGRQRHEPPAAPPPPRETKASDGSVLRVDGTNVHSDVRVSFDRAMVGTVCTVATIAGKAEVKLPAGTSSGTKLRLRGKGLADRSGTAGDHFITVQIDVPAVLDDDERKQLTQLVNRIRKREPRE